MPEKKNFVCAITIGLLLLSAILILVTIFLCKCETRDSYKRQSYPKLRRYDDLSTKEYTLDEEDVKLKMNFMFAPIPLIIKDFMMTLPFEDGSLLEKGVIKLNATLEYPAESATLIKTFVELIGEESSSYTIKNREDLRQLEMTFPEIDYKLDDDSIVLIGEDSCVGGKEPAKVVYDNSNIAYEATQLTVNAFEISAILCAGLYPIASFILEEAYLPVHLKA